MMDENNMHEMTEDQEINDEVQEAGAEAFQEHIETLAGTIAEQLSGAFAEHLATGEFYERVREVAGEVSSEQVRDALGKILENLPDEDRVRELITESAPQELDPEEVGRKALERICGELDSTDLAAGIRGLARDVVSQALTGSSFITDQAATVLANSVARQVVEKTMADRVETLITEKLSGVVTGEQLEEKIGGVTAAQAELQNAVSSLRDGLSEVPNAISESEAGLRRALEDSLSGEDFEQKVTAVSEPIAARAAAELINEEKARNIADRVAEDLLKPLREKVSSFEANLAGKAGSSEIEEQLTVLREKLAAAANSNELASQSRKFETTTSELSGKLSGLEKGLSALKTELEQLGSSTVKSATGQQIQCRSEELGREVESLRKKLDALQQQESEGRAVLATYLEGVAEINNRLVMLDISLDRMPDPASVRNAIETTNREIGQLAGKLSEMPGGDQVKNVAENVLEGALQHLRSIETELGENQAEQRMRALIREETGGLERDELYGRVEEQVRSVILEMLRTGDLHEQVKAMIRKAPPPKVDVEEVLGHIVDSDGFKLALDERFRTMMDYLKEEVIGGEVKKHMAQS